MEKKLCTDEWKYIKCEKHVKFVGPNNSLSHSHTHAHTQWITQPCRLKPTTVLQVWLTQALRTKQITKHQLWMLAWNKKHIWSPAGHNFRFQNETLCPLETQAPWRPMWLEETQQGCPQGLFDNYLKPFNTSIEKSHRLSLCLGNNLW